MHGKPLRISLGCLLLSALCTGCIPVSYYTSGSRRNIQEKTALIVPGQTTREQVLLTLGTPDQVSPDGSQMVYSWEKVKAFIGFGQMVPMKATQTSNLVITFDERNVVVKREIETRGFPAFW